MNKVVELIHKDRSLVRAILAECERDGNPLTMQALNEWRKLKDGVPPKRVMVVARVTGLKPHLIRPDIFPQPSRRGN